MKKADLAGQRFGKLTVIAPAESSATQQARWLCRCDCGNTVFLATDTITRAGTRMCEDCRAKYATERARENAGFVEGTQLSKIKNMTPPSTNTSGARGVYFDKRSNKWRARLKYKGKPMNFGSFENFNDAVTARKKAEEEYFGSLLAEYEKCL